MHAMLDDWRNDPSIEVVKASRITVGGRAKVRAVLDGEPVRLSRKVEVTFLPDAFTALVPARPSAEAQPSRTAPAR
jgi:diacylglycerol kinase family enzyme